MQKIQLVVNVFFTRKQFVYEYSIMYIFYSPQTTNFVIFDTNFTPTVQLCR